MEDAAIPERLTAALSPRYRIERELGAGGMAVVYLARDGKHNRDVAIKVLRPELAAIIGAERFLAEIEVTAQLQHPHVLPLFDSGEADGFLYYVMPHVEGESLRELLERERQLPVDEAVRIGMEVADALDYAHRQGVVHRDVKPANVLLHEGRVLVADFGIALAVRHAGGARLTETGLSLGTPHYMSPEQATADREVDARSDVYSLGAMVYEMLAGRPPHAGSSLQSVIASVLTKDPPPVDEERRSIPPGLAAVVHRALERLPADRFQSAAELRAALSDPAAAATRVGTHGSSRSGPPRARGVDRERMAWSAALLALAVALGFALRGGGGAADSVTPGSRFVVQVPYSALTEEQWRTTVDPEGTHLLTMAPRPPEGWQHFYVRPFDELGLRLMNPDISGSESPTYSPDGRFLAYTEDQDMKILELASGATRVVGGAFQGHRWSEDGYLYRPVDGGVVVRVAPASGAIDTVFIMPADLIGVRAAGFPNAPLRLREGGPVLYHSLVSSLDAPDILVYEPDTGLHRTVLPDASAATYLPFGVLVFQRPDGSLEGVEFDAERMEVVGEPRVLETGLRWDVDLSSAYAVSRNGVLVFERASDVRTRPVWVDAAGREEPLPDSFDDAQVRDVEISPDGTRLAYGAVRGGREDIWIYDFAQGTHTRLTLVEAVNERPTWTANGAQVSFVSDRDSLRAVYTRPARGEGPAVLEVGTDRLVQQITWAPDGSYVYREGYDDGMTYRDLFARSPGDSIAGPFVVTEFDELAASFSPDGRWVSYVSEESGRDEVYLRPFRGSAARLTVSVGGGTEPAWSGDGRTLYYRSGADSLVAARLEVDGGETRVRAREHLFSTAPYERFRNDRRYTVDPDEERFIFIRGPESVEVVVVTDWFDRVKEAFGIEG